MLKQLNFIKEKIIKLIKIMNNIYNSWKGAVIPMSFGKSIKIYSFIRGYK